MPVVQVQGQANRPEMMVIGPMVARVERGKTRKRCPGAWRGIDVRNCREQPEEAAIGHRVEAFVEESYVVGSHV
jgi:hypothetical protein